MPVQETGINVAVEHVDCIDINTLAYGVFAPARNHLVTRRKKNTGAGYLPSAITWSLSGKIHSARSDSQQYFAKAPTVFTSDDSTSEDEEDDVSH